MAAGLLARHAALPKEAGYLAHHKTKTSSHRQRHMVLKTFDTRISPRQLDTHQRIDYVICAVEAPAERAFETEANTNVDVCVFLCCGCAQQTFNMSWYA